MIAISKRGAVRAACTVLPIQHLGRIMIVLLCSLCAHISCAQFIPYSQYYNAPLLTNPSQAGMRDHTQLTIHYRRSRVSNYEIPALSFVRPFYRGDGLRNGAIGVNLISQKAGPGGAYQVMGVTATFAYNIYLSKNQYISAGLQGGLVNKKLDPSSLTTDSQYNFGAFDPSLSTGENIPFASETKPVINSGFSWTMEDNDGGQRATLGMSFSNINKPSFGFLSGDHAEKVSYTVTGEVRIYQHGRASIHPTFRYIATSSQFANIGAQLRYELAHANSNIMVGGWYKTTRGMTAAIQYNNDRFMLAASADLSVGTALQANIQNAIELSFGWRFKHKRSAKPSPSTRETVSETMPSQTAITLPGPEKEVPIEETPQQSAIPPSTQVEDTTTIAPAKQKVITSQEHETLETKIPFSLGSSELTPESVVFLETKLVPLLKNHPESTLHIAGHSCTTGDKAINEKVSLERAQAIRKILIGYGIPENRVVATGLDFQKPLVSNDTEEGRQKNRRVEFELVR